MTSFRPFAGLFPADLRCGKFHWIDPKVNPVELLRPVLGATTPASFTLRGRISFDHRVFHNKELVLGFRLDVLTDPRTNIEVGKISHLSLCPELQVPSTERIQDLLTLITTHPPAEIFQELTKTFPQTNQKEPE